jgi:hypothetical protein
MKIALINVDGCKNLALEKLRLYHIQKGDKIITNGTADKTYVSCIFTFNRHIADLYIGSDMGGTGIDIEKKLPEEIEQIKPHLNYGFTQRGCVRKCEFCVVHKKEKLEVVGDLLDLWDGKSKEIELYDNNIFALPEHFYKITEQAIKNKIKIDFNQGLDIRLLTKDIAKRLKETPMKDYRFAFDNTALTPIVIKGIETLKEVFGKSFRAMWYVYATEEQDILQRLNVLREYGQKPYLMRNPLTKYPKVITSMARWANGTHGEFFMLDWDKWQKEGY